MFNKTKITNGDSKMLVQRMDNTKAENGKQQDQVEA
jgi:hypothetical protein